MTSFVATSNQLTQRIYDLLESCNGQIDQGLLDHILSEVDVLLSQVDTILVG